MPLHLRVARPVSDLARSVAMYRRGLGLPVVGRFDNHAGFDGVMLGVPGAGYHFEFTYCRKHPVTPTPTVEDLIVFYIPSAAALQAACARMQSAGFKRVASHNPYWDGKGFTFEDHDDYRIVLHNSAWANIAPT